MKHKLLMILFSAFVLVGKSQTALNEIYSETPTNYDEGKVKLIYFLGSMTENRLLLKWNIAENEAVTVFEVKKSYDGKNFVTGGFIFATEKEGNETYFFPDVLTDNHKIYYRLKIIGNNKKVKYSRVLSFQPSSSEEEYFAAMTNFIINPDIK
jgi:hypothetical protein